MFRLAVFSLRHRALVVLVALALAVVGLAGVIRLPRGLPPQPVAATATVVASQPGADAQRVYREVTVPLEEALRGAPGVAGVAGVSSSTRAGLNVTTVRLESGLTEEEARPGLVAALDRARARLPDGVTPEVVTGGTSSPVLQVVVTGQTGVSVNPAEITALAEQALVPRLEAIDGVGRVEVVGGADPVVQIRLLPAAMGQAGVSAQQILSVLGDYGVSLAAGEASSGGQTMPVRVGSPVSSVDELKAIPLVVGAAGPNQAGAPARTVPLGTVTDIVQGTDSLSSARSCDISQSAGQSCAVAVAIAVTAAPDGDVVALSRAVWQVVGEANATLGQSRLQARVVGDQAAAAGQDLRGLAGQGLIGLAVGLVILGLLLRSPRAAVIAALSLPASLAVVLLVWRATGGTLNSLTTGALVFALARGLADAAVVVESLRRQLARGLEDAAAGRAGVGEVGGALAAATVCGAAAALALGAVAGAPGQLFGSFALTVAAASLASCLVALTLVPVMTCWFFRPAPVVDAADTERVRLEAEAGERRGWLARPFQATLRGALAHPVLVVVLALSVLAGTAWLGLRLKSDFVAPADSNQLTVAITFPPNTPAATQQQEAARVEAALSGKGEYVTAILTLVGPGANSPAAPAAPTASLLLTLDPAHAAGAPDAVRQALAGVALSGQAMVGRGETPGGDATVDLVVRSADPALLASTVPRIQAMAAGLAGVSQVTSDVAPDQSTLDLKVDRGAAAALGLTETQVATLVAATASSTTRGHLVDAAGHPIAVTVALSAGPTASDDLLKLPVARDQNGPVTLGSIAQATVVAAPATITTDGGQRAATLSLAPAGEDLGALRAEIRAGLDGLSLPAGVTVEVGGVLVAQADAFRALGWALLAVLLLVFLVAVAVCGSAVQGGLVVGGVLLAGPGALAALLVTGQPLGVAALAGLFLLVGLAGAQAILATHLINQQRPWGSGLRPAVVDGARVGLKPVLALAVAPGVALAPLALGLTGGQGLLVPVARVVVGGLISSTLLGLVVGPVLCSLWARSHDRRLQRAEDRWARRRQERADSLGLVASPSERGEAVGNGGTGAGDLRARLAHTSSEGGGDRVVNRVGRTPASPSESQRPGRGAPEAARGSPPSSPSEGAERGESGERLRPPLFLPEEIEIEEEPTTAERLLGELSRASESGPGSPTTGERLRAPLFTPADMALPKTPITALMTGLQSGSWSTGSGHATSDASSRTTGVGARPGEGGSVGRTPVSAGSPGSARSAGSPRSARSPRSAGRGPASVDGAGRDPAAVAGPVVTSGGPASAEAPTSPVSAASAVGGLGGAPAAVPAPGPVAGVPGAVRGTGMPMAVPVGAVASPASGEPVPPVVSGQSLPPVPWGGATVVPDGVPVLPGRAPVGPGGEDVVVGGAAVPSSANSPTSAPSPSPTAAPGVGSGPVVPVPTPTAPLFPVFPVGPDGAASRADPNLRPGPSGSSAVPPVRTLWPRQTDASTSFLGLSDGARSAADDLFRQASPHGLSAVDRSVLSLAAAVSVPPLVPPGSIEPARIGSAPAPVEPPPAGPVAAPVSLLPTLPTPTWAPPFPLRGAVSSGGSHAMPATPLRVAPAPPIAATPLTSFRPEPPRADRPDVPVPSPGTLAFPPTPSEITRHVAVARPSSPPTPPTARTDRSGPSAAWQAGPTPPPDKPISRDWMDLPGPATSWPAWGSDS